MNLSKFLAALQIGLPAVGQIVTELHPEDTPEGIKIAAGVQLVEFVAQGIQAIATAASAPAAITAQSTVIAAPAAAAPAILVAPAVPVSPTAVAAPEVAVPNAA